MSTTIKQCFMLLLLSHSYLACGQKEEKLFYGIHFRPEKTYYQDSYNYSSFGSLIDPIPKEAYNFGLGAGVHYDLTKSIFVETGLDFISRKLTSKAILNNHALPPPHYRMTLEWIVIKSMSLRMLEFPLNFGCRLNANENLNLYLISGLSGNLLLNNYYDLLVFTGYEDTYWRFYFNGYSINVGIGADCKISKNCFITAKLTKSVINSVKEDKYLLHGGNHSGVKVTHEFLCFTLGVNVSNTYLSKQIETILLKRKYNKLEKAKRCLV